MKAGWQRNRLIDMAVVSTGPFGSILHKSDYVDDGVPLVNPINIVRECILPDPSKLISAATIKRLGNYVLVEGDVVVARRGEIGRCAVIGPDENGWVCGTGSFFIRPSANLDSQFLAHLIRSPEYREQLENLSTGTTMKNLNNTALGELVIFVPPLPEQQRIVALLDEAFAALATAKTNAEKNLQNARALFESHLQSVFIQSGPGWAEKTLAELCKFSSGGTPSKSNSRYWSGTIPWVSGRDMKSTRLSDSLLHISQAAVDESSTRMAPAGTLLILVRGMGLAHGAQIAELLVPCAFNQDIRGIHPRTGMLPRYLLFALRDRINSSQTILSNAAHGTLKIDSDELQKVMIPYPPLDEQRRIVATIDSLAEETQRLAHLYDRKFTALEALKKSLLGQAFSGDL